MSAPMDGVIDSPMRQIIRLFSKKETLFTEMRHISSVANEKSGISLKYNSIEQPLVFQVSANSTLFMQKAVEKIVSHKFIELNLNAGCPAKNVIKSGSGSALMSNPDLLKKLISTLKKELCDKIPLSLKIRAGFKEKNGLEIAKMAQDLGVQKLTIHPRLQTSDFSGPLDFELVREIKRSISIPVIFSGEINSFEDAKKTFELTGVDQFMIGRALLGAPWKIKEISCKQNNETFEISFNEIIDIIVKHLDIHENFYGYFNKSVEGFKSHLARYIKSIPNASHIRRELLLIKDYKEMREKILGLKLNI